MAEPFTFKRSNMANVPGTWRQSAGHNGGIFKAIVTCPECRQSFTLRQHHVDPAGVITPSLFCPTPGCKFHQFGLLEGWQVDG